MSTTDRETYLTDEQHARAEALRAARSVLAARSPVTSGAVEPTDLHSLAVFILDGGDPWALDEPRVWSPPEAFETPCATDTPLPAPTGYEWPEMHTPTEWERRRLTANAAAHVERVADNSVRETLDGLIDRIERDTSLGSYTAPRIIEWMREARP